MTARNKALLAYLAALVTAPIVGFFALGGLIASGETLQWEIQWADRIQLIALLLVTAWVLLVAVAVRFGIQSARLTRSQRLTTRRGQGNG